MAEGEAPMLKHTVIVTFVGLGFCAAVASAQTPASTTPTDPPMTINQRLENQHDRIQAGTKADQLTKAERTRLRANDAAVRAQERVYRQANDGKLTAGERKQLNRELNRDSRQIYRDRHNHRTPKA
jgi:hypothetical protein